MSRCRRLMLTMLLLLLLLGMIRMVTTTVMIGVYVAADTAHEHSDSDCQ